MLCFVWLYVCAFFACHVQGRDQNIAACKLPDPAGDEDGNPIDWFLLYKLPHTARYVYISAANVVEVRGDNVGDENSPVILTLNGFYKLPEVYSDDLPVDAKDIYRTQLIQVFYNWEFPTRTMPRNRYSRSRGVLIVQPSITNSVPGGGAGTSHVRGSFWLTHSVPAYPQLSSPQWNANDNGPAHLFVCLTMNLEHISNAVSTLLYEQPYIYRWYYPAREFGNEPYKDDFDRLNPLTHILNAKFISVKDISTVGGLTVKIASQNEKAASDFSSFVISHVYRTDKFISWNRRNSMYPSISKDCLSEYPVSNILGSITVGNVQVDLTSDESRWMIAQNGPVCILSGPRTTMVEMQSSGGICFEDARIVNWFQAMTRQSYVQRCD